MLGVTQIRLLLVGTVSTITALVLTASPGLPVAGAITASEGCKTTGAGALLRVRLAMDPVDAGGQPVGQAARDAFASKLPAFEARLEQTFREHGYTTADGLPIELDIDAFVGLDSPIERYLAAHRIDVEPDANYRSHVDGMGEIGGRPTTGKWGYEELNERGQPPALHENGHLLGLDDQYREVVTDNSGRRVAPPRGMKTDVKGNIRDPGKWRNWARQHGLDPGSMSFNSEPKPGHANDLMATTNSRSRFRNKDLRKLLKGAPDCNEEDAERLRLATEKQAGMGPEAKTCYRLGRGPLKKPSSLPFIPYSDSFFAANSDTYPILDAFPDARIGRYQDLQIGEEQKLKLSCTWQREHDYMRAILKWADGLVGSHLRPEERIIQIKSIQSRIAAAKPDARGPIYKELYAVTADIAIRDHDFNSVIEEVLARDANLGKLLLKNQRLPQHHTRGLPAKFKDSDQASIELVQQKWHEAYDRIYRDTGMYPPRPYER